MCRRNSGHMINEGLWPPPGPILMILSIIDIPFVFLCDIYVFVSLNSIFEQTTAWSMFDDYLSNFSKKVRG